MRATKIALARRTHPDAVDFALAERMHMTLEEIRAMPGSDYHGLLAYFSLQAEYDHHASVHAKNRRGR